ncbi:aminoacyl-histidine dipeptidase [Marinomonas sp. M1K-6]|uniref:Cytosol non-specific dipeptidase n=1 Tax=Marinomonas profundi TaxID=2726122 RepID=A0A847QZM9_9GAMM|nr:aminoacyl-histidine dipeptidase [Marinomonas profundi]NLQ18839.1 aminoacyl-histidine dipeptidase [Marinomonas profundi]UDV02956.1 aminoacyl-histidine dipeptidase [Marinomonas profundi]
MNEVLTRLQPTAIWRHFQTLCNTPRPSYHEAALREHLIQWATELGHQAYVDPAGNLLIRKAASKGMEDRETVVLQGHLDMVAQKNVGIDHDFTKDPIVTQVIDGWVHATGTTLGADNGIGVAAAMAVLESTDLAHGPIEALFTIEEETSLRGALQLEEGILKGKILLNLDSEDRGDVYIGCAGGMDINIKKHYSATAADGNKKAFKITVSGLRGGHSGLDIHKGRASANVLIVRLLNLLKKRCDFGLSSFSGGTLRNAISRDAIATINVNDKDQAKLFAFVAEFEKTTQAEFSATEENLKVTLGATELDSELAASDKDALLNAMYCAPHGVHRMSADLDGVTETSCNFGVINLRNSIDGKKVFDACLLVRSLVDSAVEHLAYVAKAAFSLIQAEVTLENGYPGWRPDPKAGLLKHFLTVHTDVMGHDANVKVIHAGLECGIIGAKYPGMEMVSFGPNIRGAHSPTERMEIDSVADFWRLLIALLESAPKAK